MFEAKNIASELVTREASVVKENETCSVFEDSSHFWKIIKINEENLAYRFDVIVKQAFAEVHRGLGIGWEVFLERNPEGLFLIEKREKLQTCDSLSFSLEDCLKNSLKITHRVEEKLRMRLLLAQIRQSVAFRNIRKIGLVRYHEDELEDFAIFGDSTLILGDSGWFLALLNRDGKWENALLSEAVEVSLEAGDFCFASQGTFDENDQAIASIYEITQKWWLFPKDGTDVFATRSHLKLELEDMLKTNAKILSQKTDISVKDETSYFSFQEESAKLRRLGAHE